MSETKSPVVPQAYSVGEGLVLRELWVKQARILIQQVSKNIRMVSSINSAYY